MNFWARTPLNLVADRVKNSVPPLLRTLRFCVGRQGGRIRQLHALTSQAGAADCPEPAGSLKGLRTESEVQGGEG